MNSPKSRPQLDSSIIRRPGQAAPVSHPSYTPTEAVIESALPPSVAAPAPAPVQVAPPLTMSDKGKNSDNMPWLGGKPWTRKLGIRIDEERVRRIKIVAAARGTTMEELLVDAIDQYMDRTWGEVSRGLR
jgi:hypothetical protein